MPKDKIEEYKTTWHPFKKFCSWIHSSEFQSCWGATIPHAFITRSGDNDGGVSWIASCQCLGKTFISYTYDCFLRISNVGNVSRSYFEWELQGFRYQIALIYESHIQVSQAMISPINSNRAFSFPTCSGFNTKKVSKLSKRVKSIEASNFGFSFVFTTVWDWLSIK